MCLELKIPTMKIAQFDQKVFVFFKCHFMMQLPVF